jgi:hypothetical protein
MYIYACIKTSFQEIFIIIPYPAVIYTKKIS